MNIDEMICKLRMAQSKDIKVSLKLEKSFVEESIKTVGLHKAINLINDADISADVKSSIVDKLHREHIRQVIKDMVQSGTSAEEITKHLLLVVDVYDDSFTNELLDFLPESMMQDVLAHILVSAVAKKTKTKKRA